MPYYNGFPATYAAYNTPTQYQTQSYAPGQSNVQNSIIWVQGEAGAKSYLVAPNTTIQLWDSESQTIYLKSADASGMPSMKVLDYTIRESAQNAPNLPVKQQNEDLSIYATREALEGVTAQITALRERVDNLTKRRRSENNESSV